MSLRSLIVDTDMAIDDWIALLYLLQSDHVDLRAITIAGTGEAHGGWGRRNALRLLALGGQPPCDVATGRAKPLRGNHTFPLLVRWLMDIRLGLSLPDAPPAAPDLGAQELLAQHLRQTPAPLTLLTLGPLTNLAEVLLTEPQLVQQIAMIYSMGGALDVPGNLGEMMPWSANPYAEWNFFIDPYAVDIVLRSGAPITLIPLDETNRHPLTNAFYERLRSSATTAAGVFLVQLLRRIRWLLGKGRTFYFWDPLAAVVATHPEFAQFHTRKISIITDKGAQCGRLIDDVKGNSVTICTGVDQQKLEAILLQAFATGTEKVGCDGTQLSERCTD